MFPMLTTLQNGWGTCSPSSNPRRQLKDYLDEYFVAGGISTGEYRILAICHAYTSDDIPLKRARIYRTSQDSSWTFSIWN